jgi:cytochrome c
MTSRLAIAAALALALAACGSDKASEEAGEAAAEAVAASETSAPAAAETATPEGEATTAAQETLSPTPTPTPTVTATATTVATATVVAGSPPDSYKQCAICHKVEPGQHGLGPSLAGVFGARAAHAAGYNYSPAMRAADLTWNQGNLDRYLASPQAEVPGTTMAFAGVKDAAKRAEIIAYLKTL